MITTILRPEATVGSVLEEFAYRAKHFNSLRHTIRLAQFIYPNALQNTLGNVNSVIRDVLKQIEALVMQLEGHMASLEEIDREAVQIANDLPVAILILDYRQEQHHEQIQRQNKYISSQRIARDVYDPADPGKIQPINNCIYGDRYASGNNDETNKVFLGRATPGWCIVSGSSYTELHQCVGDYDAPILICEEKDYVQYQASTRHRVLGCSGLILFDICFKEETYTLVPKQESMTLTWGGSCLIPVDKFMNTTQHGFNNHWKMTFAPFDGDLVTICDLVNQNYLIIEETSQGYQLSRVNRFEEGKVDGHGMSHDKNQST